MPSTPNPSWPALAVAGWMLMGEATMVVWLRSMRLMMGGPAAGHEAKRMVAEKLTANMSLVPALLAGGIAQSPKAIGAAALAHYGKPIRANRRRLSRKRGG